jgi:tetratricopeptide (TPR) repeat protein
MRGNDAKIYSSPAARDAMCAHPTRRFSMPFAASRVLAVVVVLAWGTGLRADVVTATGRPAAVGVTIVEMKGGDLVYRLGNGEEIARRFAEVDYLQVTGWSAVNAGEKARREGRLAEAAGKYQAALAELSFAGGQGLPGRERLDRGLLVRCRLVQVYDAAGQFDRALESYLEVVGGTNGAAWLEPLRPAHLPDVSWNCAGARVLLDRCIERHEGDAVAVSLKGWRATWPGLAGLSASQPTSSRPAAASHATVTPEALGAIRAAVEGGRFDEALQRVEKVENDECSSAELFYWRGRALEGQADRTRAGGNSGTGDRSLVAASADVLLRRAGLAYMRVVIHFADHALAAECLYRAGAICQRTGDGDAAERLWKELLGDYPQSAQWVSEARKGLEQLAARRAVPALHGERRAVSARRLGTAPATEPSTGRE